MVKISDKEEDKVENILNSFGFGDLAKLLKESDVFSERMEEVSEQIKERLDSEEWEEAKPKFDYNFSIDTLDGKSKRSSRPKKGSRPRDKEDESSWSTSSAKFKDGKKKDKEKKKRTSETQSSEPMVDLFEEDDIVRIVAMFPEISGAEELELNLQLDNLILKTEDHRKVLTLPYSVKEEPKSIKFKNGIFDIKYEKK